MLKPVLGTFSKGCDGSVSLNFSYSGGPNCDEGCAMLGNGCYAEVVEKRYDRKQLKDKLHRHAKMSPALICGMALFELQQMIASGFVLRWFRISSAGSAPMPAQADPLFVSQFRALLSYVTQRGADVHFPVESPEKAAFYRAIVGDLVCIRESLQSDDAHLTTEGAVSFIGGKDIKGGKDIRNRRVAAAKEMARQRKLVTGRNTIVCPAVTSGWAVRAKKRSSKIHCGECDACANRAIDVVYPFH